MATGFGALCHHGVKTTGFCRAGMAHGAGDVHHLQPGIVEFLDQMRRRHTEAGDKGRGTAFDDDVGGTLQRFRHGGEKIDAKWLVGQIAGFGDFRLDLLRRTARHAERAETARVGDGGAQFGVGDSAHAGQQDGIIDLQQIAEWRADGHQASPVIFRLFVSVPWAALVRKGARVRQAHQA